MEEELQAYCLSPNEQCPSIVLADLAAVKAKVRCIPKDSRTWARVTLEEFRHNKAALVAAYNGHPSPTKRVIKKWRIGGPRGGKLIEIPVDEE